MKKSSIFLLMALLPMLLPAQNIQWIDFKLTEGPEKLNSSEDMHFTNRFHKLHTRYIYGVVNIYNLLLEEEEQNLKINLKYYGPDGYLGESDISFVIPPDWSTGELWNGYGYREAGKWKSGEYRVEAWYEDSLYDQEEFVIYTSEQDPAYWFRDMQFFEASDSIPDKREFDNAFSIEESRYIYTEIKLNNLKYLDAENEVNFTVKYYKQDGTLFGEPELNYNIPVAWSTAEIWTGWGYDEAGYWEEGIYRVEVWDGDRPIASDYFIIY